MVTVAHADECFSALQRAENSSNAAAAVLQRERYGFQCSSASRKFLILVIVDEAAFVKRVSVLFSEPKIPHPLGSLVVEIDDDVSVLFSEPKIPH